MTVKTFALDVVFTVNEPKELVASIARDAGVIPVVVIPFTVVPAACPLVQLMVTDVDLLPVVVGLAATDTVQGEAWVTEVQDEVSVKSVVSPIFTVHPDAPPLALELEMVTEVLEVELPIVTEPKAILVGEKLIVFAVPVTVMPFAVVEADTPEQL